MAHRLLKIAAQITAGVEEPQGEVQGDRPLSKLINLTEIRALTRADDEGARMDGARWKGFQRIKLPPQVASVVPTALRRWQTEAAVDEKRATKEANHTVHRAMVEGTRGAILSKDPKRVMTSWDNDHTLRVYLVPFGSIIRQSNVLSGPATGAFPVEVPHTDLVPLAVEKAAQRKVAERRGCAVDEVMTFTTHTRLTVTLSRALGISPDDISDEDLARYQDEGVLHMASLWMSPDHSAKPLALFDRTGVDYSTFKVVAYEKGPISTDFTKKYSLSDFPGGSTLGQMLFAYRHSSGHHWCYFEDLAEDEALVFSGLDFTFHAAFTRPGHEAKVERVSCEMRPLCLVVDTREELSMSRAATFLSAVRDKQRKLVFGGLDGERDVASAMSFLKQLVGSDA